MKACYLRIICSGKDERISFRFVQNCIQLEVKGRRENEKTMKQKVEVKSSLLCNY